MGRKAKEKRRTHHAMKEWFLSEQVLNRDAFCPPSWSSGSVLTNIVSVEAIYMEALTQRPSSSNVSFKIVIFESNERRIKQ